MFAGRHGSLHHLLQDDSVEGVITMLFAVNGTLMRGFELNENMHDAGATFVRQAKTAPIYRCWSIDDGYLGMVRDHSLGAGIAVELWEIDAVGLGAGPPEGAAGPVDRARGPR